VLSIYTNYKCKRCNRELILITEEREATEKEGGYISCPHCGSKHIIVDKLTDSLKECMSERAYKRQHGAMVQKNAK